MKNFKKALCIMLSVILCLQLGTIGFAAGETSSDYTIVNPYADVVWEGDDAWGAYKGSLHSHTTYSDANYSLEVMVKEAYARGFDFLAIADHGITGVDWDEAPFKHPLYLYQHLLGYEVKHLTTEEYEAIKNGTYNDRGYGMTPVLGANEFNNLSLSKNHVNGHFLPSNVGNTFAGAENEKGFDDALAFIEENGGLSYINHPGDWLDSNSNPDIVNDAASVSFFGDLILKYDSCLGIEILNERNGTTGYDRVLWDNLLMYTLPYGKNVIAFSNNDTHWPETIDSSFSVFMMEENTSDEIKETMQTGAFFAVTRRLRENTLNEIGPYAEIDCVDSGIPYPMFTNIAVEGHSVSVSTTDSTMLQWIANGKVIKTVDVSNGGSYTLNLDEIVGAENFAYIRAELFGEGGLTCSQAFVLDDGSEPAEYEEREVSFIEKFITFFKGTKLWAIIIEITRL
ncbi:MAG: hypothetical protein J6R20_04160 [Clostridia bacterium]|nr:hypothetical protein [Clostridia bacterium]